MTDRPVTFREPFPMLGVADPDRSVAFYRDLLGFTLTYRSPDSGPLDFAYLTLGGAGLGVGRRQDPHAWTGQRLAHGGVPSVDLCVYVDDLDAATTYLASHGVEVITPPADMDWGERTAWVADPDGHQIMLTR